MAPCLFRWIAPLLIVALAACGGSDAPPPAADASSDARDALDAPGMVALGGECSDDGECGSGICAGGTCCATACAGACRRCDQPGALGTCTQVAAGTACGGNLCLGGQFVPLATCDQQGVCNEMAPVSCAPGRCLENKCVSACTRDDECEPPFVCRLGACGKPGGGVACTANEQCASNICAQGVCCNRACNGPCESCALPAFRGVCQPLPAADRPDAGCAGDAGADAGGDAP